MIRLRDIDLDKTLSADAYHEQIKENQRKLVHLQLGLLKRRVPAVLVFEGWDASGKGGTIRRLLKHVDPRAYHVYGITKPTEDELAHHYLARFWHRLPARGRIAIFDRSWYGRVLVERVEGFATKPEWQRAYGEINQLEKLLADDGCIVLKFFMHISKGEQKQRFDARAENPLKSWKLNPEDYRNRAKWSAYEEAIDDMLARTDSPHAPWHVIPANDKRYARVQTQKLVIAAFTRQLAAVKKAEG